MNILVRSLREIDWSAIKQTMAQETDFDTLITESTLVTPGPDQPPLIVYQELDDVGEDATGIADYLATIDFSKKSTRTAGFRSINRNFGFVPRRVMRNDYCYSASLSAENPVAHQALADYAARVVNWYRHYNPDLASQHESLAAEKIRPEYRIEGGMFTSGVVNFNNVIPYHFDAGNFRNVWSCMLVFKRDVAGGYLSVPQLGLGFELKNNSLFMFDGQSLAHGVTPIHLKNTAAYRYSIVYYSLQNMWNCLPITEELIRIRKLRTQREDKRAEQTRQQLAGKPD